MLIMKKTGKIHPKIFEVYIKYINLDTRLDQLGLEDMLCDRGIESYLSAIRHMMDNLG